MQMAAHRPQKFFAAPEQSVFAPIEQARLDDAIRRGDDLLVSSLKRDDRRRMNRKLVLGASVAGAAVVAAPQESSKEVRVPGGEAVRLTIELSWRMPPGGGVREAGAAGVAGEESDPELILELSEGQVLEAITWPPEGSNDRAQRRPEGPGPEGSWR